MSDLRGISRETTSRWTELLEQHGDYLYAYAILRVRDETIAEHIVEQALLAAVRPYGATEIADSERIWLVGIIRKKILEHFREFGIAPGDPSIEDKVVSGFEPFETAGNGEGHWREDQAPSDWHLSGSPAFHSSKFREALDRCLANLPRSEATVYTLREIDGLSPGEISELFGISPTKLGVMLHRARLMLRQAIETEWFNGRAGSSSRGQESARKPIRKTMPKPIAHFLKRVAALT